MTITPSPKPPVCASRSQRVYRKVFDDVPPAAVDQLVVRKSELIPNPLFIESGRSLGLLGLFMPHKGGAVGTEDIVLDGPQVMHTRREAL